MKTNYINFFYRFYFGTIDNWCPLRYYEEMKSQLGDDLDAVVCQKKIEHAFVLSSSQEMANIIVEWIKRDSNVKS